MAQILAQCSLIQNTDRPTQLSGRLREVDVLVTIPISQTYSTATAERINVLDHTSQGLRQLLGINQIKQMRFHTPIHTNQYQTGKLVLEFDVASQRVKAMTIGNGGNSGGVTKVDYVEAANGQTLTGGALSISARATVYF